MRILILGSGAREHALVWKLGGEIGKENVFVAPGNGGTQKVATNVALSLSDFDALAKFCIDNNIDTLLPGSEDPIANGIRDFFEGNDRTSHIYVFSPDQQAGQLESSKAFAKEFMLAENIPTAVYQKFNKETLHEGYAFLGTLKPPYVLKADGLAAGKGVLIIDDLNEAKDSLREMLDEQKFGEASSTVVIEEFLDGIEFSVFVATDGKNYVLMPEAKDYKRIGEGDTGLNTGGMGAVSPVPFFEGDLKTKTIKQVIEPTIRGFKKQNINYRGFVFFGLIAVEGNPMVIEYNVRMGDPETEVVIPRMMDSLSDIMSDAREGNLVTRESRNREGYCTTVFSVSGGYPEAYEKGKHISISQDDEMLFHAGTKPNESGLVTNGGRVIAATQFGSSLGEALKASYALIEKVKFSGKNLRTDIGKDLMKFT